MLVKVVGKHPYILDASISFNDLFLNFSLIMDDGIIKDNLILHEICCFYISSLYYSGTGEKQVFSLIPW